MPIMSSQNTKLELTIVGAAFLVLLLSRQPPKSGNAGIARDSGLTPPAAGQRLQDGQQQQRETGTGVNPDPAFGTMQSPVGGPSFDGATPDNTLSGLATPPQPKTERIGVVDPRQCTGLNYKEVLYGKVTVQWVWNGRKLVPRKVCEVTEPNGVTSVWTFEGRDDITVSEIQQQVQP